MKGKLEKRVYKSTNGNNFERLVFTSVNGMEFYEKDFNLSKAELYIFSLIHKAVSCIDVEYYVYKGNSKKNIDYYYVDIDFAPNYIKKFFINKNEFIALGGKI